MFTTTIWRLLLLIVFFGITNRTWGQRINNNTRPIEQADAIRGGLLPDEDNSRLMFCDDNIITNGDFEDFSGIPGSPCENGVPLCSATTELSCFSPRAPFLNCNVNQIGDWWISHGTPEILRNNGNLSALMWAGRFNTASGDSTIYGEGLFVSCYEFKAGNTYEMKISMMNTGIPLTNLFITLANGLDGPNDYQNPEIFDVNEFYEIPNPIGPSQNVFTNPGFSSSNFVNFSFSFTPNQDYSILSIRPFQDDPNGALSFFYIDNVCVSCTNPENTVVYTTPATLPALTTATNLINAKEDATVYSGNDVTFRCSQEILLEADFRVEANGKFLAVIDPVSDCGGIACAPFNTFAGDVDDRTGESSNEIEEQDAEILNDIVVYPNPNNGQFRISFPPFEELTTVDLIVRNILGESVFSLEGAEDGTYIDLSNKAKGIYFLEVKSGDNQITKRLIIQ